MDNLKKASNSIIAKYILIRIRMEVKMRKIAMEMRIAKMRRNTTRKKRSLSRANPSSSRLLINLIPVRNLKK